MTRIRAGQPARPAPVPTPDPEAWEPTPDWDLWGEPDPAVTATPAATPAATPTAPPVDHQAGAPTLRASARPQLRAAHGADALNLEQELVRLGIKEASREQIVTHHRGWREAQLGGGAKRDDTQARRAAEQAAARRAQIELLRRSGLGDPSELRSATQRARRELSPQARDAQLQAAEIIRQGVQAVQAVLTRVNLYRISGEALEAGPDEDLAGQVHAMHASVISQLRSEPQTKWTQKAITCQNDATLATLRDQMVAHAQLLLGLGSMEIKLRRALQDLRARSQVEAELALQAARAQVRRELGQPGRAQLYGTLDACAETVNTVYQNLASRTLTESLKSLAGVTSGQLLGLDIQSALTEQTQRDLHATVIGATQRQIAQDAANFPDHILFVAQSSWLSAAHGLSGVHLMLLDESGLEPHQESCPSVALEPHLAAIWADVRTVLGDQLARIMTGPRPSQVLSGLVEGLITGRQPAESILTDSAEAAADEELDDLGGW